LRVSRRSCPDRSSDSKDRPGEPRTEPTFRAPCGPLASPPNLAQLLSPVVWIPAPDRVRGRLCAGMTESWRTPGRKKTGRSDSWPSCPRPSRACFNPCLGFGANTLAWLGRGARIHSRPWCPIEIRRRTAYHNGTLDAGCGRLMGKSIKVDVLIVDRSKARHF
jgi:hypothetical protein